jgi:Mg-chelatase subunit ChlD
MISLSIRKAATLTGVKIHVESVEQRDPTHFVILLDLSDSMNEEGKLENVKKCISLLMQVINTSDYLSLITFATDSKIHLKRVVADSNHRAQIDTTIGNLKTNGWTNLSAGLSNLVNVLDGETLKTGVILLTDGHANKGMADTPGLLTMIEGLRSRFPRMSISSIAYGTDHNSDLLLKIAQLGGSSSYSIVKNLEDAATAIGDCVGGFMSLVAQNADLHFPLGTEIQSSYPVQTATSSVFVRIGDLYSGTDTLILVKLPEGQVNVSLTGTYCKELATFFLEKDTVEEVLGRDQELELTDIRYKVSCLFKDLRTSPDTTAIRSRVEALRTQLSDTFLAGPVCDMLLSELTSIENVLNGARVAFTTLQQHEAFTGLGRGVTTTITSSLPRPPRGLARQTAVGYDEEDPNVQEEPVSMLSPFQSQAQRSVATVLRSMSSQ